MNNLQDRMYMILEYRQWQSVKGEQMLPWLLIRFQDVFDGEMRMRDPMGWVHRHVECHVLNDEGDMDPEENDLYRRFFLCQMELVDEVIHHLYSKRKGLHRPKDRPIDASSIISEVKERLYIGTIAPEGIIESSFLQSEIVCIHRSVLISIFTIVECLFAVHIIWNADLGH